MWKQDTASLLSLLRRLNNVYYFGTKWVNGTGALCKKSVVVCYVATFHVKLLFFVMRYYLNKNTKAHLHDFFVGKVDYRCIHDVMWWCSIDRLLVQLKFCDGICKCGKGERERIRKSVVSSFVNVFSWVYVHHQEWKHTILIFLCILVVVEG